MIPPQEESEFPADKPFRLVIGHDDCGEVLEAQSRKLFVKGVVKIDLPLAKVKSFKLVELRLTSVIEGQMVELLATSFRDHASLDEHSIIWDAAGPQPLSGGPILQLTFSIPLPRNKTPPGGYSKAVGPLGVRYLVTLRAQRKRILGGDVIIAREVSIPPLIFNKLLLNQSTGVDLFQEAKSNVLRPACKLKGAIHMHICLPGQDRPLPLDTDIPFTVTLKTVSMPVTYTADPVSAHDINALTPTINTASLHQLLRLKLIRQTRTRVAGSSTTQQQNVECASLGSLEDKDSLDVDVRPRRWLHDPTLKNMGRWVQKVSFRSQFNLASSAIGPTFRCKEYSTNYELELRGWVPMFETTASGTQLKISVPIEVCLPR
ncbi:hypothetical protein FIBSPDRAFT_983281 [Athelia psychrophila]|uniref:Arrestin-like N-terminal domain-containing protein n=1 Tax=Athelia psychrophila TaxID=1759441 RepID=A0A166C224_9AGAM|nr:hypothetical protein FIBSPDRAFT_983281 [Fibularhizoctonia sp. CBS 109695]